MITQEDKNALRKARHDRMRFTLKGTEARPRLNVYRSLNNIYAQVIDDTKGVTLAAASTLDKELRGQLEGLSKQECAKKVGELAAKRAIEKGVKQVVFDRGGYLYTGRVEKVAQGAREAGLEF